MFAEIGPPEGIFVECITERGEPEVKDWELGGWAVGVGLAKGLGEAAGDEHDTDGRFGFQDFAYDAGFVHRLASLMLC